MGINRAAMIVRRSLAGHVGECRVRLGEVPLGPCPVLGRVLEMVAVQRVDQITVIV